MTRLTRRHALQGAGALALLVGFTGACAPSPVSEGDPTASGDGMAGGGFVDGVRLAAMIATGEISALEAVEAAIARAEAVNPQLNAIATTSFEEARAAAASAPTGAFAGVPTFIKDLEETAGVQTMYGSRAFRGFVPEHDGPLAAKWKAAGLISIGKSTSPEIGLTSSTEPLVTGITRNPWDLGHIPGGSSGGAAALTAARVVPFAHASDGGGSIRIPAACCGLFGLKPSRGRIAPPPDTSVPVDISVNLAVTWTVRDSAALFSIAESGAYPPIGAVTGPSSRRLRIGFAPDPLNGAALDPQVRSGVEAGAQLCRDLGHEVIDFAMPFDGQAFIDAFVLYWAAGAAQFVDAASRFSGRPPSPEIVEPLTLGLAQRFADNRGDYDAAVAYLVEFEQRYEAMFDSFDVLLTPTLTAPPVPVGTFDPTGDFETVFAAMTDFVGYTPPMNVAGAASMSVPLHMSDAGLPIGVMFSGKRGDDGMLLELAYELEEAAPWIDRLPPVHT